jgi:hypothetical protein
MAQDKLDVEGLACVGSHVKALAYVGVATEDLETVSIRDPGCETTKSDKCIASDESMGISWNSADPKTTKRQSSQRTD